MSEFISRDRRFSSDFLGRAIPSGGPPAMDVPQQSIPPPEKPKKKRLRRQKMELDYLRDLVKKLETQMAQLKTQQLDGLLSVKNPGPSLWKPIAERQQKGRESAEEENQKLRASLETQLKLAKKLERFLRKWPEVERQTNSRPTDDEIFADQYAHVMRAHLDADALFRGAEFANRDTAFCNVHVTNDASSSSSLAFVTKANAMLPFDIHVAEKALWRAFIEEGAKKKSYFYEPRLSTADVVSRSYEVLVSVGPFHTNVRGKETYRKYVEADRVMIMWKTLWEPSEINDTKFQGLKCVQTGLLVLRAVDLSDTRELVRSDRDDCNGSLPMTSTSMQSCSTMTLELQDDIGDHELQVGALTNFVVNTHDTITDLCGKAINGMLVEEDWKANGWLDDIAI